MAKKQFSKEITIIHDGVESFVQNFLQAKGSPAYYCENLWYPPTDIIETDDQFIVIMEVSGVEKKDISINITDGILEISGYRYQPNFGKSCKYHSVEIVCGRFKRHVAIGPDIESAKTSAYYSNGLLQVILPKQKKEEQPLIRIQVEK